MCGTDKKESALELPDFPHLDKTSNPVCHNHTLTSFDQPIGLEHHRLCLVQKPNGQAVKFAICIHISISSSTSTPSSSHHFLGLLQSSATQRPCNEAHFNKDAKSSPISWILNRFLTESTVYSLYLYYPICNSSPGHFLIDVSCSPTHIYSALASPTPVRQLLQSVTPASSDLLLRSSPSLPPSLVPFLPPSPYLSLSLPLPLPTSPSL
ncbi:hypothetical protein ACTXT7_010817 [Hymenolepis weldensis]